MGVVTKNTAMENARKNSYFYWVIKESLTDKVIIIRRE